MPDLFKQSQEPGSGYLTQPGRMERAQSLDDEWHDSETYASSISSRQQIDEDAPKLQIPQIKGAPSRSPSQRSWYSSSSPRSTRVASEEYHPTYTSTSGGVRKPKRTGPLTPDNRERTKRMRKVGACTECRRRKVRVGSFQQALCLGS